MCSKFEMLRNLRNTELFRAGGWTLASAGSYYASGVIGTAISFFAIAPLTGLFVDPENTDRHERNIHRVKTLVPVILGIGTVVSLTCLARGTISLHRAWTYQKAIMKQYNP